MCEGVDVCEMRNEPANLLYMAVTTLSERQSHGNVCVHSDHDDNVCLCVSVLVRRFDMRIFRP